jgi:hypothetical protein
MPALLRLVMMQIAAATEMVERYEPAPRYWPRGGPAS